MSSDDFPSGPWTGYYQYPNGEKGQQDLLLTFQSGRMNGTGQDDLGSFMIDGSYDESTKNVDWLKSYPDGHLIFYRGFREGPLPGIWGTWMIPGNWSGGFHIWPLLSGIDPNHEEEEEAPSEPAKRMATAPLRS